MRHVHVVWLVLALLLWGVGRATAQEVQIPLDEAGRIEVIDDRLAQQLGLFVDRYPGFREARLFQAADSSFVLEITTEQGGRLSRERLPLMAEEAAALRRDVRERLAERAPRAALNQEGRYLLLGQTSLLGLAYYGWALPYALGTENASAVGLYLLTAGASFFVPFAVTEGAPVSYGMANLSRYGATRGIAHGLLLHSLIAGEEELECNDEFCYVDDDFTFDRTRVGTALLVSVAEGVGGYVWARGEQMPVGTANAIVAGGDLGLLWGAGTVALLDVDSDRAAAAISLPLAAAGIIGGHRLAAHRDYTWGDADVLYTAGAVGAFAGFAAAEISDSGNERLLGGAAMLGAAAGVYLADGLVRGSDFSVGQATLNRLGATAGALAGASFGVLVENEDVALAGAALGAIGGYLATYSTLAPVAREQRGERMSSWNIQLSPQAAMLGALARNDATAGPMLPLVNVQYRFGSR